MVDFRLPPLNAGERLYRALLHAYPVRFRRRFAQDLIETFRDERRTARHTGVSTVEFWLAVAHDVVSHGLAERVVSVTRLTSNEYLHEGTIMTGLGYALRVAELRIAVRRLRRAPAFSVAVAIVLALGIGATTAVFSVVNGVLLRPLPYPDPDALVAIRHTVQVAGTSTVDQSDAGLLYDQEHATAFQGVAGWRDRDVNAARPQSDPGPPERVSSAAVTANLFDVLGVHPVVGRGFRAGEDRAGAAPVVVLSNRLWQRYYHGDRAAIGRLIVIDGIARQIIGVMPDAFRFIVSSPELWYPMPFDPATATIANFNVQSVARLRPGQTLESARADLARITPHLIDEFPSGVPRAMWDRAHVQPVVISLRDYVVGDAPHLLWILLGSISLVLVIACANVASLFLVRGESRQLELAVRGALGSGVAGMMAQALSESLVLATVGGGLGVVIAIVGIGVTNAFGGALGLPRLDQVRFDLRVFAFAAAVSVLSAMFVGLIPMLRARRIPIGTVLREAGRGGTPAAKRQRARSALVVAQMALALVLIAASGLLARSFERLSRVEPGFWSDGVRIARTVLPAARYPTRRAVAMMDNQLLEKARAIPGVRSASLTDWVPLTSDRNTSAVAVEAHPVPGNGVPRIHSIVTVDDQYFTTMRIPILSGRTFAAPDPLHPSTEALVSGAFARRYWPDSSALGKRIHIGLHEAWLTIVGVTGDAHYTALDQPADEAVYLPLHSIDLDDDAYAPRNMALVVAGDTPSPSVAAAVRQMVRDADRELPTYDEHLLSEIVSDATARARVTLALLAAASALALVLGAVGIYGVMAYAVSLRQREIGVRLALGAQPAEVRRMVSRQGLRLGLAGVGIGALCALATLRLLRGLLFEISPADPVTLGCTCVGLLGIALLASWIPARRAAAVDPSEALRLD